MYDPFAQDADFVACYPFGLRGGVPTAMSHGMWLNVPDYDGPTQLGIEASSKPCASSHRLVDAVVTIPRGVLFPCCGMNLAFDREAVGPCMYFGIVRVCGRGCEGWARKGWAEGLGADGGVAYGCGPAPLLPRPRRWARATRGGATRTCGLAGAPRREPLLLRRRAGGKAALSLPPPPPPPPSSRDRCPR